MQKLDYTRRRHGGRRVSSSGSSSCWPAPRQKVPSSSRQAEGSSRKGQTNRGSKRNRKGQPLGSVFLVVTRYVTFRHRRLHIVLLQFRGSLIHLRSKGEPPMLPNVMHFLSAGRCLEVCCQRRCLSLLSILSERQTRRSRAWQMACSALRARWLCFVRSTSITFADDV